MKALILALALAALALPAWAQVGQLHEADVIDRSSQSNPSAAMKQAEGGWLAFSIPVLDDTRSPCCWKGGWSGDWNGLGESGCSLRQDHQSYGTRSDSPLTDRVIVYARIEAGSVSDMRLVGEQCPVNGGGSRVHWLGEVGERPGLEWLAAVSGPDGEDSAGGPALFALALHRSEAADDILYEMALAAGDHRQQEAIFWMGETRGDRGLDALDRLLAELSAGDARREIPFAMAQNGSDRALERLIRLSRSDPDPGQRGMALFWLADAFPEHAPKALLAAIERDRDTEVLEQAVFAISQLPSEQATAMLLDLARDGEQPREVRRHALFWLAQSDDDEAVEALAKLLTGP